MTRDALGRYIPGAPRSDARADLDALHAERDDLPPDYLVALDAALADEPRALDAYVRRLHARAEAASAPWDLLEEMVSEIEAPSRSLWESAHLWGAAARAVLASRGDRPPADLGRALEDGWVHLHRADDDSIHFSVFLGTRWATWRTGGWGDGDGPWWVRAASSPWSPTSWSALTPDQRTALLAVWAEVRAWREAGRPDNLAPWSRR